MLISRALVEAMSTARKGLDGAVGKIGTVFSRRVGGYGGGARASGNTFEHEDARNRHLFDGVDSHEMARSETDDPEPSRDQKPEKEPDDTLDESDGLRVEDVLRAVQDHERSLFTGLGADVDIRVSSTPIFCARVRKILQDGWEIEYGPSGGGSRCSPSLKKIVIDFAHTRYVERLVGSLAHEVGHALHPNYLRRPADGETFEQWHEMISERRAAGEGEAAISQYEAALEAHDRGHPEALRGSSAYRHFCDEHWRGEISRDEARQKIGEIYRDFIPSSRLYSSYDHKWYTEHLSAWKRWYQEGLVTSPPPDETPEKGTST